MKTYAANMTSAEINWTKDAAVDALGVYRDNVEVIAFDDDPYLFSAFAVYSKQGRTEYEIVHGDLLKAALTVAERDEVYALAESFGYDKYDVMPVMCSMQGAFEQCVFFSFKDHRQYRYFNGELMIDIY